MKKLLFTLFAIGCVYNIQAEEAQEVESTTEQVEENETPVVNKQTLRPNVKCPHHADCKTFLKFAAMNKRQKDYQLHLEQEAIEQAYNFFRMFR